MSEYGDKDRHHVTCETFTSLIQLIVFQLGTEADPMVPYTSSQLAWQVVFRLTDDWIAHPQVLGLRPVSTIRFDEIARDASHLDHHNPRINPPRFEYLSKLLINLWNSSYEKPDRQRVLSSLEPLGKALQDFFSSSSSSSRNSSAEPLPEVWNVINWWLLPPHDEHMFRPAPLIPWDECLAHLKYLEGRLRASRHILDVEKANLVRMWLLEDDSVRMQREQSRQQLKQYDQWFQTQQYKPEQQRRRR
ncbi:hypothetical protein PFICI_03098 [Pestalotiopsis fici W106-1]|uniref:Uncharacterized protein n=1 Tax=Pestalotiopsis fici (strain W106-1 / CGMCC3.15140) TaxID=1229662 RepID=W3XG49_PESFW|nr:uncharacterized protein PFICI_03098 [Pestalotiopsis fici W106-1]ETS85073.1 hypothetical protein PFICI_03098 [Pestalotiopsis fici W106-1]